LEKEKTRVKKQANTIDKMKKKKEVQAKVAWSKVYAVNAGPKQSILRGKGKMQGDRASQRSTKIWKENQTQTNESSRRAGTPVVAGERGRFNTINISTEYFVLS
jgi:hypothetical protein